MSGAIKKIIFALLAVAMAWGGLASVFKTGAVFLDSENSNENSLQAGTLNAATGNSLIFSIITGNGSSESNLLIDNVGTLPFNYLISVEAESGELCPTLELSASLEGGGFYPPAPVGAFAAIPALPLQNGAAGDWTLVASLTPGTVFAGVSGKSCNFTLVINTWQENLAQGQGFNNHKEISASVSASGQGPGGDFDYFMPGCTHNPNIIINEFLPDPFGDDAALKPGGEWVELYNAAGHAIDLNGWMIYSKNNGQGLEITSVNTGNGTAVIDPGGFLVVYRNGDKNFRLKEGGNNQIRLYNGSIKDGGEKIDGVFYPRELIVEGKSFARIPDGFGPWIDPIPTPGTANRLNESEMKFLPDRLIVQIETAVMVSELPAGTEKGAEIVNDPAKTLPGDDIKDEQQIGIGKPEENNKFEEVLSAPPATDTSVLGVEMENAGANIENKPAVADSNINNNEAGSAQEADPIAQEADSVPSVTAPVGTENSNEAPNTTSVR